MATILTFRSAVPERDVGDSATRETTTAQVIVFPGVRYERWQDAADATGVQRQASSKTKLQNGDLHRDVLELAE